MRINVLISTTRQWNPGDEFIMHGALNVLQRFIGSTFNPIIFNRNPEIRGSSRWHNFSRSMEFTYRWANKDFKGKGVIQDALRIGHFDNSYKDDMDPRNIDLAVFAGSPEWYGNRLIPMYKAIDSANIPTAFLGLGAGSSVDFASAVPVIDNVLKNARLITTRDRDAEKLLKPYGAIYMPCTALLAAKENHLVRKVNRIGLIYATDHTVRGNNVSPKMHSYIVKLYKVLAKHYHVGLICHYIDELDQAKKELPEIDLYYSYDSKDYVDIYNSFDLIVGGRVHGIGMSASLGIPGIMIKHDNRSNTTDGFLAPSVKVGTPVEEVIQKIKKVSLDVEHYSDRLIEHKKNVMNQYISLLDAGLSDFKEKNQ